MVNIEYVLKITAAEKEKYEKKKSSDIGFGEMVNIVISIDLGSAQNEVLSNSGTIRVILRYLAIATISHICKTEDNSNSG